nr:GNAT family N-acetyltransferase [uncultured Oscillibacter sp.]
MSGLEPGSDSPISGLPRRRGLALARGARLILACLDRGLYPSWDAHPPASLALAERLDHALSHPCPAFAVSAP